MWFGLLGIGQWALILPHELRHALAGRALPFKQIRIIVGGGRPIFSFNLLGFPVLINLLPCYDVVFRQYQPIDEWLAEEQYV